MSVIFQMFLFFASFSFLVLNLRLAICRIFSHRWGTRSAHIFTIGLPLAIADHLSIDLWNKVLLPRMKYPVGTKLSIARTPGPFLFHAVT